MYRSGSYRIFQGFNTAFMLLVIIATLFPFIYIVSISLSNALDVMSGKVSFFPVGFNLSAYKQVVSEVNFWISYKNTLVYTFFGTLISLGMTIICAYPLSRRNLYGRKIITGFMVFTMFFSGGLVPLYILVNKLGLVNSMWAMIFPYCISTYYMVVMRTFFEGIPESIIEAAEIDGLNPIWTLVKVVLPLSKPTLASILLFYAIAYWNSWFDAMLFLNRNKLFPVTLYLRNIIMGSLLAAKGGEKIMNDSVRVIPQTLQASTIVLVILPILCAYPFVQKYFIQGVMIGSIKG